MVKFMVQIVFFTTLILSLQPSYLWSKEQPIDGILLMYNAFNKLEGEFRTKDWTESKKTVRYMRNYYSQLTKELKKTVDEKTVNKFGYHLSRINGKLNQENSDDIEAAYMDLQKTFLSIMEYYEYPTQPAIIIYARYIDEAKEGLEKGDFQETAEEMEEIKSLKDFGVKALKKTGATDSEITTFFETIERVERAARAKDISASKIGLEAAETQISKFMPTTLEK